MNAAQQAEVVIELAAEPLAGMTPKGRQVYLSQIVKWAKAQPDWTGDPKPKAERPAIKPMNDVQARAFDETALPFGNPQYKGRLIGEDGMVAYIDCLFDPSPYMKQLEAYAASDHAARRRELETR